MYKLKQIATQQTGSPCMGLSVPSNIAVFFENTFFKISRDGNSITFTSGVRSIISDKQVENYNFQDVRI